MTNLTEQWKNGELPEGEKYIQLRDGRIFTAHFNGKEFREVYNSDIKEILAPVPTYEEWQRIFHYAGKYEHEYTSCVMDYENLKQENQQLKELLKECRDYVVNTLIELKNGYCYEENDYYHETKTLLTKIDNAIGEKK